MGISVSRSMSVVLLCALVAGACGGDAVPADTTRAPITTTLPLTQQSTSVVPPSTTNPAATTNVPTTTSAAEPLPDSIGGPDDERVAITPSGATRVFYAGSDLATSVRPNSVGNDQVLYYDIYQPAAPNGLTALYIHDGAIDAGYANGAKAEAACSQLAALGAWCVAIEYRRGFAGFDSIPRTAREVSPTQAARFTDAFRDARNDVLEAWFHLDTTTSEFEIPKSYVVVGEGAGAMIAADIALATPGLPYVIAGAILASGTHEVGRGLSGIPPFPVVIQGSLFDEVYPAYSGPLFLDDDMPSVLGARTLYDALAEGGATVQLYLNAQDAHGLNSYRGGNQITFLATAVDLMLSPALGTATAEYLFNCDDANFGAAAPGAVISTDQAPGFRYEPYESDLESGLTPAESLEIHPLETPNCQN